jgi:WD40 repeat protein
MLTRWVREGAKDDTPAPGTAYVEPPVYTVPPIITSIAFSPDGSLLAVAGYHEVLLHKADGSGIVARLVGESPRIESIAFSKDGKLLAAAGGAPAEFGQVQVWDVQTHKNVKTFQPSTDSLYGVSFSPDAKTVACGAADKVVRRIDIESGKVVTDFRAHADWVLATLFTLDGKTIVSGGRDKAMKLIDVETGRFVDDINNPVEQILCMARHPTQEQVLYGGDLGVPRIYKISDNQGRTSGRNDTNLLVTFERQPGPVSAAAFSPDGSRIAVGSIGEVRVYDAKGIPPKPGMGATPESFKPVDPGAVKKGQHDPKAAPRSTMAQLTLSGSAGPIFGIAWKPDGSTIATAGFDGNVRLYDAKTGALVKQFVPVPIGDAKEPATQPASARAQ